MSELGQIKKVVEEILENDPKTRNSDMRLFIKVCDAVDEHIADLPLRMVLENLKRWGVPKIESVGRARRKAQETRPDLKASKVVEEFREEKEQEFRDFALRG